MVAPIYLGAQEKDKVHGKSLTKIVMDMREIFGKALGIDNPWFIKGKKQYL